MPRPLRHARRESPHGTSPQRSNSGRFRSEANIPTLAAHTGSRWRFSSIWDWLTPLRRPCQTQKSAGVVLCRPGKSSRPDFRGFTAEDPSATPEAAPPDLGRRYQRGRFWSGRRDANRDQTGGLALDGANRFSPSDVVRPDPRRRRGWVNPPPAQ
jgi:hypothetical protein